MTGRHEGPPLGSAAREATAPSYRGKRRAEDEMCRRMPTRLCVGICDLTSYCYRFPWADSDGHAPGDERAPDCWTCGHYLHQHHPEGCGQCACTYGYEEPDDPPRCWSCGHPWDAGCECSCCGDNAPEGWGPDAC